MGILMKRMGSLRRSILAPAMVLTLGLAGTSLSFGNGVDPALQGEFQALFPTVTHAKNLSKKSRSSRDPQVLELRTGDHLQGYGVAIYVVSRSGPFRILVSISPDETVMDVIIPKYPHRRGRAVKKQTFLDQFNGVSYGEPLKLGEQVDGVSGATSSATALTGGVRQALLLVHRYRQVEK